MELWSQELNTTQNGTSISPSGTAGDMMGEVARTESLLSHHNDSLNHMQNAVFNILQRGQEVLHLLETSGHSAQLLQGSETRVQTLLETLHQSQMDLDDAAELRRTGLELDVQIVHLKVEANQVNTYLLSLFLRTPTFILLDIYRSCRGFETEKTCFRVPCLFQKR